jgi:hypothetical protein
VYVWLNPQKQPRKKKLPPPSRVVSTPPRKIHRPRRRSRAKATTPSQAGQCFAVGCKHSSTRFNFCEEHFDHFKFGLIKKTGERVSDYEKKIEHYQAHQAKSATPLRKAA